MEIIDKIKELLNKISDKSELDTPVEAVLEGTTEVTGMLIAKEGDNLLISVGRGVLYVPIKSIVKITESESQPAVATGTIEITIELQKDAKIKVVQLVKAGIFTSRIGMKPLIYDIPSNAPQFAIPNVEYEDAYEKWLEDANLSDFPKHIKSTTFTLTSKATSRRTTSWTTKQTTTQNADTKMDSELDDQLDSSTDLVADVD